ncbi:MAG: hypothetical protein LKI22_02405 [Liquorilactobacillus nagelii]|jgi:hypothetical protein|uniref:hypothetical protein n=1 Tax=Liquorilactobacillus nagelii TaxID=82688 RepID=UPI0024312DA8|nr:hypothetical protein [Liquorilactobacillus nagelii]MCI1632799.1 hypothetical protein [Liquorilactobacillus nagelii]
MTRQQKNHLPQNYQHSDFTPADYQLVKGVIKSIGITITYPDYQDLLQEGALILLEALASLRSRCLIITSQTAKLLFPAGKVAFIRSSSLTKDSQNTCC